MSRTTVASLVAVAVISAAAPVEAQVKRINQTASLNVGYYALRAEDARPAGDVLVENLNFLSFDPKALNGATFGGDYFVGVNDWMDFGVGLGYYKRTAPSVYREYISADGYEVPQDLKLRVMPVSLVARFLPISRYAPIVPYAGVGVAAYSWRYSESGEFIDLTDFTVFRASYVDSGTEVGPVYLAGFWVPAGDSFGVGFDFRYQQATADLDPNVGFFGDKIDIGGYLSQFTFLIRF
jgi:hypothetical protein